MAVLTLVGAVVFLAGTGAAHLFAAATTARAQLKPTLAIAPAPEPVLRRAMSGTAQQAVIASLKLPEPRLKEPIPVLALAYASDPEPEFTGSVSAPAAMAAPALPAVRVIADAPVTIPRGVSSVASRSALDDAKLSSIASRTARPAVAPLDDAMGRAPLPTPRPKLASLMPPDNPVRKEEDAIGQRTAIYDITAQAVYLPSGERLEAHSGFGPFMDDPKNVHRKMRGSTPPNTYALTLREQIFHGVQAIRMTPVNEGVMYGRDGILAHSFLLGPNGQSHGCVSFRDYPRFLAAFQRGEIDRMVVVARLAKPPAVYARRTRSAAVGGPHDAVR